MNRVKEVGIKAGVVGMGRSGAAAARLLANSGFSVVGFDNSPSASGTVHMTGTVFGEFSESDLSGLSMLVLSPGVPVSSAVPAIAEKLGIPLISEVELAWLNTSADVLAITGSNGKTTTVEWLTHVIRLAEPGKQAIAAGNIGYAFSDAILDNPECPVFVLELSSYQLETTITLKAVAAAILNLTPDHLARHGTMENYGKAKGRIFLNQAGSDTAVLNYDDPQLEKFRNTSCGAQMYFSLNEEVPLGAWMDKNGMLCFKDEKGFLEVIHSKDLALPGKHNIANALAVICMAVSYGIPAGKLTAGLREFSGVPHRIEPLGKAGEYLWFNDSKSTNIDSLKVALESFENKVVLLAGGKEKSSDYGVLKDLISEKVKGIVLFGSGGESLATQWQGSVGITVVNDLEQAVQAACLFADRGDSILLSPGCASFDQYRNFEERGDHFKKLVEALK